MSGIASKGSGWLLAGGILVAAAVVAAGALLVPDPPQRMAVPSAGEMLALAPYLDPAETDLPERAGVPETVRVGGSPFGGVGVRSGPAGQGGEWPAAGAGGEGGQGPRWALSAVLIVGDRRIAIVNDRMVRPGDRLEEGVRVASIGSDHVVLIMPDGERRRLDLERQEP